MDKIEQILTARDALAMAEYIQEYTKKAEYRQTLKNLPQEQLIESIARFTRSRPGHSLRYNTLNEATIVLLSACLEGFIEELHTLAMQGLMRTEVRSARAKKILNALSERACRQFDNPQPDKIKRLFRVYGIDNVFVNRTLEKKEIHDFVDLRNDIAHGKSKRVGGKSVEELRTLVLRFGEELSRVVRDEMIAVKSGK